MRRMSLILFACAMLAACQAPGAGRAAAVPGEQHLEVGDSITLPGHSTLAYVRVVADSRCRPEVTCIRAGDADIELRWTPASAAAVTATLNSDPGNQQRAPNAARLGAWNVRLKALDWRQPPAATLAISAVP